MRACVCACMCVFSMIVRCVCMFYAIRSLCNLELELQALSQCLHLP